MSPDDINVAASLRKVARILRRAANWAGVLAIVAALAVYGRTSYLSLTNDLNLNLAVQANVIESFIVTHPDSWEISDDRLAAVLSKVVPAEMHLRVLGAQGDVVTESPGGPAGLSLTRTRTLYSFGHPAGRIELSAPLGDLVVGGFGVLVAALVLAMLFWGPLAAQPLKALARAESELTAHETALSEALIAAEAANRAKSEFLASMSHELRTPLNAVLGYAQLFATDPDLSQENRDVAGEIERAGNHLLTLINDVLDLARIEAGRLELERADVPLDAVIGECLKLIAATAQRFGITIRSQVDPARPVHVRADAMRLRQVLLNFMSNGAKYNRPGGRVDVLVLDSAPDRVRVAVRDNGRGLSIAAQQRLFTPFDRLGEEGGSTEGTGIGLVICKRIVEAMDGRIGFESSEGVGSTFWVDLPRAES